MNYYFQAERLAVGYNGKPVVENIEVNLPKGKILTLIGPNGCGKSTILKSITKQLKNLGGVVRVDGVSIAEIVPKTFARKVSVVLTERPKPELMTCWDVAAAGRYPYTGMLGILSERDKEIVRDALRLVGALELKDRNFSEISDGQRQRVMLARAVCQEPEIIVLDEPTTFLDIRYAIDILAILRRMASERGVTVVMSLHELNYAKRVSDLVMCVKNGGVMFLDTPEVIFTRGIIGELYDLPEGVELFGNF